MVQQAHNQVIMPLAIDEGRFALPAFDLEAAFLVGSNGALIDGENTQGHPVQA
jgi:hypothetical protein